MAGRTSVYEPHLKPRLEQIREARGLGDEEPLPVDLLMVSHVDDDHIQGILELTKELRARPMNDSRSSLQRAQPLAQQLRRHHRATSRRS